MPRVRKRIGKAQAREEFSSLIETVLTGGGAVEITDYGKVAAVLLSENEYKWLLACAARNAQPKRDARGSLVLGEDLDLDAAAKEIARDFVESLKKTAGEL